MAFVILLAISAVMVLGAGFAMYVTHRLDPQEKAQWTRQAPYFYLGVGVVMLIAGWLSHAGAASWVQMAAGSTLAVSGAYLAVRNRSSQRS
jgi:protein-S-isoprenylcysteine O-methyltransferase Ste14